MAIDRSKFKKTSAAQLAQADKNLNKAMGKRENGFSNGHDVDEGINLFRIYPVHPDIAEKDPTAVFAVPYVSTFLPAMVQVKDQQTGKPIEENGKPKIKESVKPVYNAKVHGGMKKDLVEEYIRLANKNAKDMNLNENDRKEYLKYVYGSYNSYDPSKSIQGINYPQVWIVYADKFAGGNPSATPIFDEWRLKKSIKERLNKIAAVEAANDPLGTDPFTDIEEGKAVRVLKDTKTGDAKNTYTTELDNSTVSELVNGKTYKVQKTYPLTDSQLEQFLAAEPLHIKYGKKLATRKNFENQLSSLELFDQKYNMGIFDLQEWNDIVIEIDGFYPENDGTEPNGTNDEDTVDQIEEVVDENQDEFDLMDRKELQAFAKENKTGILVKPSLSDDEVREKLREWKKTSEIPHVPLPNDDKEEVNNEKEEFLKDLKGEKTEEETKPVSAKDRLATLRAKTQGKAA
jgi:hypothetical protein